MQRSYAGIRHTFHVIASWLAAQLENQQPHGTIASLDGVRATACLMVIAFHISLMTRTTLWQPTGHPLTSATLLAGESGVTLFFVLSGFLLFLPYAKALLFGQPWPGTRLFYLRRALRILPGYYCSLALLVLLAHPEYLEPPRWRELLLFALLWMDSTRATFRKLNGPYWTLAVEWQFYLLLPLITLFIRLAAQRVRPAWRIWIIVGCLLGLIAWGVGTRYWGPYLQGYPTASPVVRTTLDAVLFVTYGVIGKYLEDFAVGMLACLLYLLLRSPSVKQSVADWARRLSPWCWGIGVMLLLFLAMRHYSQTYSYRWPVLPDLLLATGWPDELGLSLGFGCCILAILFDSGRLKRWFQWAPLRWIGVISYSLYIWHLPLLIAFTQHLGESVNGLHHYLAYSLYWGWVALVVSPFSLAIYLLIEKPGIRFSNRLRHHLLAKQTRQQTATQDGPTPREAVFR